MTPLFSAGGVCGFLSSLDMLKLIVGSSSGSQAHISQSVCSITNRRIAMQQKKHQLQGITG